MWKFVLKRLLALIPVLLGVTLLIYCVLSAAPGDPARTILGMEATAEAVEELRESMGLNKPVIIQYFNYIGNIIFHGDFGTSWVSNHAVVEELGACLPYTFALAGVGLGLTILVALPLGIIAGIKQNSIFDNISMAVASLGLALPSFWLGLLCILLFSVKLGWLPSSGTKEGFVCILMPAMALSLQCLAGVARTTRSSLLEVIRSDYVRTARSKGISKRKVIMKHALPNAMIPTLTVMGLQVCTMISGAVLVENIFAWPGIGRLLTQSVNARDIPMVLGCIVVFTVSFSIINLIVDLLYAAFDPRIKAQYKR